MNLDELNEDGEEPVIEVLPCVAIVSHCPQEKSEEERSDAGSQAANSDYDVDEEYDNDYAEDYFDNGEGDDLDDLGGGGDDGGGGSLKHPIDHLLSNFVFTGEYDQIS